MIDYEKIEDEIKADPSYWGRFKFTAVQFSHAGTNVLVEGLRDLGVGEKDEQKRKRIYEGGDDAAYTIGHIIGAGLIILTPLWAPTVPFIFGGALIYKKWKERGK